MYSGAALSEECLVVIDAEAAEHHWNQMLGAAMGSFVPAETMRESGEGGVALQDDHVTAILINADAHMARDWALRLRQEPDRFHCPIILVSFQREVDVTEEDDEFGTGQLGILLNERWQATWVRLPVSKDVLFNAIAMAGKVFSEKVTGQSTALLLRQLGVQVCKGLVEYKHTRYRHGRGSFTSALWLLVDGVRTGNVTHACAQDIVKQIESKRGCILGQDVTAAYDFPLVERLLKLVATEDIAPEPAYLALRDGARKRRMLLIEDEYGWKEVLDGLLPSWTIIPCQHDDDIAKRATDVDLVLVDQMLYGQPVGTEKICLIRTRTPITPVVLFTNDRRTSLFMDALGKGADGVILKQSTDASQHGTVAYFSDFCNTIAHLSTIPPEELRSLNSTLEKIRRFALVDRATKREVCLASSWSTGLFALSLGLHGPFCENPSAPRTRFAKAAYICLGDAFGKLFTDRDGLSGRLEAAKRACNRTRHGWAVDPNAVHLENVWGEVPLPTDASMPAEKIAEVKIPSVLNPTAMDHEERADLAVRWLLLGYYADKGTLRPQHRALWRSNAPMTLPEINTIKSVLEPGTEVWEEPKPDTQARVLHIVDSDAHAGGLYKVLCRILYGQPIQPRVWATTVAELDESLAKGDFRVDESDCILLDIGLARHEGQSKVRFDRASLLEDGPLRRLREELPDVPIVIFSATENASVAHRCIFGSTRVAYAYHPKIGTRADLEDNDQTAISRLKSFYTEFRQKLDVSPPLLARRGLTRFRDGKLESKFKKIEHLDNQLVGTAFEPGLRKARGRIFQLSGEQAGATLGGLLRRRIEMELETLHATLWLQEVTATRGVVERVIKHVLPGSGTGDDSGSHPIEKYVWVGPAGTIEWLSSVLLAIVTNAWPKKLDWQVNVYPWILLNRGALKHVASPAFNRCWIQLWELRNEAVHGSDALPGNTQRASNLVDVYCKSIDLLMDQFLALSSSENSLLPLDDRSAHKFGKEPGVEVRQAVAQGLMLTGVVVGEKLKEGRFVQVGELNWVGILEKRGRALPQRNTEVKVVLFESEHNRIDARLAEHAKVAEAGYQSEPHG